MLRGAVQCQPVAKLETKIIEVSASSGAVCPINIVHPILHQRVVLLQLGLAAIVIIQHFGNEGGRIAPDPGAQSGKRIGQVNCGGSVVSPLVAAQIPQELAVKSPGIHVKSGGGAEYLRISGPTQPLIPLRTIGRNVQEVGFQPPKGIGEQAVDFFISGSDESRPIHFRVDRPSLKTGGIHAIQSADLHIAEAEEGEARADLS